jgi:hypothetical protein
VPPEPEFERVDRSFQTDARAKPARPENGAASGASGGYVELWKLEREGKLAA